MRRWTGCLGFAGPGGNDLDAIQSATLEKRNH
jgi:hypothetical protein